MGHYTVTFEQVAAAFEFVDWTYAKTMPRIPHYYTLKEKWGYQEITYLDAVAYIDLHGEPRRWRKTPVRRYLDVGDWRYWHIVEDGRLETSRVLNRQLIRINEAVLVTP